MDYFSGGVCEKDWFMYDQYCVQVSTDLFDVTSILATENPCNQGSPFTDTLVGYWLEVCTKEQSYVCILLPVQNTLLQDLGLSQASEVFGFSNDSKCFDSKGVEYTCEQKRRVICKKPCKI